MGFDVVAGGSGEIRTHGRVTPTAVFKTAALNHSATLPFLLLFNDKKCLESVLGSRMTTYLDKEE